jgi:glycosyltransferase involved in cell wall biosynthesis
MNNKWLLVKEYHNKVANIEHLKKLKWMTIMKLSVIVPAYNVEKYLARCLDSILNQGLPYSDYEIVIVNDGSTDSSIAIAEEYQKKYANVKLISQNNQGLSAARNTGIRCAVGEYLYFIDSDDYIENGVFKHLLDLMINLELDFLGFDTVRTNLSDYRTDVDLSGICLNTDNVLVLDGVSYISKYNFLNNAWWYIVKKDLLINNGLHFENGRMLEDGIFTTEVLLNCKRAVYLNANIHRYFINMNSIMTNKKKDHLLKLCEDFKFVIVKFAELLCLAKEKKAENSAILRLKTRQEAYVFFLFVRLLKVNIPFYQFREVVREMKSLNAYPIKNFIGIDYNSIKFKLLTLVFNNLFFLYLLIQSNQIFKFIGDGE